MFWSFTVKGTFPQYKPPNYKESRIDNKLTASVLNKLNPKGQKEKNWINNNINKFKHQDAAKHKENDHLGKEHVRDYPAEEKSP